MSTDEASAPFRLSNISGDCSRGERRERGKEREGEKDGLVNINVLQYLLWCMHVEMSLLGVEIESVPLGGEPSLLTAHVHVIRS